MDRTDDDLLNRARAGDHESFEQLLLRHSAAVRATVSINKKWSSKLDVDDVMAVTYSEAYFALPKFTENGKRFRAWLTTIAKHNLVDSIRMLEAAHRIPPTTRIGPSGDDSEPNLADLLASTTTGPATRVANADRRSFLETKLDHLPADYATVIRLRDLEQKSYEEVARVMQRSEGGVRVLHFRAIRRLGLILRGSTTKLFSR